MDAPASPAGSTPLNTSAAAAPQSPSDITAAWESLLDECTRLHSQLEYLHLMLRLGVHRF